VDGNFNKVKSNGLAFNILINGGFIMNNLNEVRRVDNIIIADAELEAQSQQVNIQRAFR